MGRFSSLARLKASGLPPGDHRDIGGGRRSTALFEGTYFVGLRKAGMPEESGFEIVRCFCAQFLSSHLSLKMLVFERPMPR